MDLQQKINTISVRFEVVDNSKAMARINHNLRFTKKGRKSVVPHLSDNSWVVNNDNQLVPIKSLQKDKKEIQQYWKNKINADTEYAKNLVNDKSNKMNTTPKGRVMRWAHLEHNPFLDCIVGFGTDFRPKDIDPKILKEIAIQAKKNMDKYFMDVGSEPVENFVIHCDEEGNGHFHFQARNTNLKSGAPLGLHKANRLSLAQDAIFENMERFGLRRGTKYSDLNPARRYMTVDQYKQFMSMEDKNKALQKQIDEQTEILDEINTDINWIEELKTTTYGSIKDFMDVLDVKDLNEQDLKSLKKIEAVKDYIETAENITLIKMKQKQRVVAKHTTLIAKSVDGRSVMVPQQTQSKSKNKASQKGFKAVYMDLPKTELMAEYKGQTPSKDEVIVAINQMVQSGMASPTIAGRVADIEDLAIDIASQLRYIAKKSKP